MRAVDTNVVVRLLAGDDQRQAAAADEYIRQDGAWISHVVLVETVSVLESVYERSHAQLVTALEMLLDHEHLSLQDPDVVAAALARYRKRPKPGFFDCLVLEIARKAGHLPLGTFDRNLAKQEGVQRLTRAGAGSQAPAARRAT